MTIGSQVRTALLRALSQRPQTVADLAHEVETTPVSVHRHLHALEDLGLVSANRPRGKRRGGAAVVWSTNKSAIRRMAELWSDFATGTDAPGI